MLLSCDLISHRRRGKWRRGRVGVIRPCNPCSFSCRTFRPDYQRLSTGPLTMYVALHIFILIFATAHYPRPSLSLLALCRPSFKSSLFLYVSSRIIFASFVPSLPAPNFFFITLAPLNALSITFISPYF